MGLERTHGLLKLDGVRLGAHGGGRLDLLFDDGGLGRHFGNVHSLS